MYESMLQLNDYLVGLFASRRKARAGGLLDRLLIAVDDPAIDFGEDELLSMVGQLIFAGHETTMHFIANAVHALLSRRALWDQLLENPALLAPGIEELLRLVSPSQFAARTAAEDLEIGDVKVARWETVRLLLGAANRDPDRFENPDEPEFGRPDSRHVAFGLGPHFCLGAALTRREATIALGTLLRRFPDLELLNSSVSLLPSFMFHGFTELWVQLP
jgi:cytochrome P450